MKSTRITKQNKLRKNSKLKKRFIRGGSKKGNKKHVKRSIEKKSRKMRGSGETVERKNEGYESETVKLKLFKNIIKKIIGLLEINTNAIEEIKDALSRLSSLSTEDLSNLQAELEKLNDIYQPSYKELNQGKIYATVKRRNEGYGNGNGNNTYREQSHVLYKEPVYGVVYESETIKLILFKNIVKKIIGLLEIKEINTNAIEEIKDALSRLSSLSTEDLSNLQAELEKLNDIYQPSYQELNQGKIYATVKRPPLPPPRRPRLRINCSIRSNQECIEFDGCELVQKKNRGRFGLFRTINTCVEKKTPAA